MSEFTTWATWLTRLEVSARKAAELCEAGKFDRALGEMTKMRAYLFNAQYDLMKKDPRFFAETDN